MADLSDEVGESLSSEIRALVNEWFRDYLRRHLSGDERQRQLGLRLQKWSYDCPHDPYQAIEVKGAAARDRFVQRLENDNFDVKVYKSFVCVHRSHVADAMTVAVEMGIKDEIREPLRRKAYQIDCHSAQVGEAVLADLRAAGIECAPSRTNPHLVNFLASDTEVPTASSIFLEHGVDVIDALERDRDEGGAPARDEEPKEPGEVDYPSLVIDAQTEAQEVASRPATQRQRDLIDSLVKEGVIPSEEVEALGRGITLAQAHELLDRYYEPLHGGAAQRGHERSSQGRDESAREDTTLEEGSRDAGTKEVVTSDRVVEVGMSDRTDYVSSEGQDVVERHDVEDEGSAAREDIARAGAASTMSKADVERENAKLERYNETLEETKARLDRVASSAHALVAERGAQIPTPER